jgi:UDP-N-acetylglucosamine 2-epimerase
MDYDLWLKNMHKTYEAIPGIQFTIMSTYNLLSVTTYTQFLQDVLDIKRKYGTPVYNPLLLDIPYLRYPEHQTIFLIEEEHLQMIHDQVTFMYQNLESKEWSILANRGFYQSEADKLKRIYTMAKNSSENSNEYTTINRKDFVKFVDEHDKRRGTNFLETFPELTNFYNKYK